MPGHYPPDLQVAVLYGLTDRYGAVSASGGRMAGFRLTPLGWQRCIGKDASAMANRVVPLAHELGTDPGVLRAELAASDDAAIVASFDALLTALATRNGPDEALLVTADQVLRCRPGTVPDFAAEVGVAPRTRHRLCLPDFHDFTGMSPRAHFSAQRTLMASAAAAQAAAGVPLSF